MEGCCSRLYSLSTNSKMVRLMLTDIGHGLLCDFLGHQSKQSRMDRGSMFIKSHAALTTTDSISLRWP